ncbi:outer membrane beta-barrel family protein [Psychroflexus sediminis]|uniref:Outer membrane receptor proteins, mostly Fe transport n=1 Tax=Psychroflexus sediminis TaxID=470826 RepID=A0A1G7W7S7_9FLAO|nr:outer membrane beta-barrel family protein [Psychroflexus sediminis]SDG67849.1 Outer membrane receptor proteins, mostly Fe transport [Psychroflexus sediminis]
MKTYRTLLILISLLISGAGLAQGKLTGLVQDAQSETIPFANVVVLKVKDSTIVSGGATDMNGNFNIDTPEDGAYFLEFSTIGFQSVKTEAFKVENTSFQKDFGVITLHVEENSLDEVLVIAERPRIEVKADKLVVNVAGTVMASGTSAYEVLAKSPGVWLDQNGDLQLNGKANVAVMIDGRPTYLSSNELQSLLKGMSSENIKNIEIISNPSAKYEAEGTAGILNVILKKNKLSGMNGSAYAGYEYNGFSLYNTGINLNYKKGKWNSFVNLDASKDGRFREQTIFRTFDLEEGVTRINQNGKETRFFYTPSLRMGTDYEINERHSVGVTGNLTYQNGENDWDNEVTLNPAAGAPSFIDARNHLEDEFYNASMNMHYQWKLDTVGSNLSADLDYVKLNKDVNTTFTNVFTFSPSDSETERLGTDNFSEYDIYAARVDLGLPLPNAAKLEFGAKASQVKSRSTLEFYEIINNERIIDPDLSNRFSYDENIYAAYGSFSKKFNETWNLQAGLRLEQTVAEGYSATLDKRTPREYLDLFPSLFVQQNISEDYKVSYSLSRRITRPNYERLNPFIFYLDPYSYVEGNPDLRPQYTNSFQLTQTYKNKYNLILGAQYSKDFIIEVPIQNEETNQTAFAFRNIDRNKNFSATLIAPLRITKGWRMDNNLVASYQYFNTQINGEELENEQFSIIARSNHQISLPYDISWEINASYTSPMAYGLYRIKSRWGIDTGFKKSFMQDKLDVNLAFTDLFRTQTITASSRINNNLNKLSQYMFDQSVRLTLRYNFSSGSKFESKRQEAALEELKRAGGD